MFLQAVDPRATKNEIRDALFNMASDAGRPISKGRADNLADKFKKGKFDPLLVYILGWSDETGEHAVEHLEGEGDCSFCGNDLALIRAVNEAMKAATA